MSQAAATSGCCPPQGLAESRVYRRWNFICGTLNTAAGPVPQVATDLRWRDVVGRWLMRWGFGRSRYRVAPGLYAVGKPEAGSPVLVTANYKLSFDALRRELAGLNAWILVLDTKGINVWCAAGKGTFGTAELVGRVAATKLVQVVEHRTLILPQLGAPGVAAHEVRRKCGFRVVYGPVRAADLHRFLAAGMQATAAMRQVTFSIGERLVLTPVEMTGMGKMSLWVVPALLLVSGIGPGFFSLTAVAERGGATVLIYLAGLLAGCVATPVLLPWLPGRAFAAKGAFAGALIALVGIFTFHQPPLLAAATLLFLAAVASYGAMNFTGSTPFTSPSGVEKEMRRAIPLQGAALLVAAVLWLGATFV